MKNIQHQHGLGVIQVLLGIVAVAAVTAIAVPKYQELVIRSRMSEALTLASDPKSKLSEFYIMNNRFPRSERETGTMKLATLSKPKFVDDITVNYRDKNNEVVVEVYFLENSIPGATAGEHFLYLAGNTSDDSTAMVEWTCGAVGIEQKYLPSGCQE
jgi:type IV pilus assembly protein PilA